MKWRNLKPRSSEREFSQSVDEHEQQLKALCADRDTRWYSPYRLKLNVWLFLLLITSMSNGFDGSMMNGLQTLDTWSDYFGNPRDGDLGLLNAIQNIGNLAGLPFAPYLNDHLGRKWTLFLGCCFMILATALQTASQSTGMFLASRFFIGFGNSWASISAPIWLTELAFPTHRAPLTSMYNSMWYLGSIVAAWTTFGTFVIPNTWAWRIPSLVQGVPPLLQMLVLFWIPESPRWLVSKGRDQQAIQILAKYHCHGDDTDPLVAFEYDDIQQTLAMERAVAAPSSWKTLRANGFSPANVKTAFVTSSWVTMFTDRCNLRRFRVIIALAFFSQWSGNGIVSYYLNLVLTGIGITGSFDQLLFNGCLQIYNLITALVGALVVERAGRRTLFLTSTGGMCLSYMVWTILSARYEQSASTFSDNGDPIDGSPALGRSVAAIIFIYYGFYNIAMSPLIVSYTVEILPYRIRSKGLMVFQVFVSAALVFNQYVNPIALGRIGWRYYIVYTCWLAFEFIYLFFTVVETKGKNGSPLPLEEIARLFDGDDARPDINPEELRRQSDGTVLAGVASNEKKPVGGAGVEHVETMGANDAQIVERKV